LERMDRRHLDARHGRARATHVRSGGPESRPVLPVRRLMLRREAPGDRIAGQVLRRRAVEVAGYTGEHDADAAAPRAIVALQPGDGVQRPRLDLIRPADRVDG